MKPLYKKLFGQIWSKKDSNKLFTYSGVIKIFLYDQNNGEWYISKNIAEAEFQLQCENALLNGVKGLYSTEIEVFK